MEMDFFPVGSIVVYGLHGKCRVTAIENRSTSGNATPFYKLEVVRPPSSRVSRPEPAIWVPAQLARNRGLRALASSSDLDRINAIFASAEFYFRTDEAWSAVQPQLETAIARDGVDGLAKAYSYLMVLKRRQVILQPEVQRFFESVQKILFREIAELTEETHKAIEARLTKLARAKFAADQ